MQSLIMLHVTNDAFMLSVVMLNVIMLSVFAPILIMFFWGCLAPSTRTLGS
jgi:hypothetical protein